MARHLRRILPIAAVMAVLTIGLSAGPVGAGVILRDHYSDDYTFSFDDCGFWIDVDGHTDGVAHIRVGKGDLETAFFAHDNYAFQETWTRRDTGTFLTLSGNGVFQETKAVHLEGTTFTFTSINAGQPFIAVAQDGTIIARDRGVIREVILFDTLGDGVPGGEFIESLSFEVAGPHPGLEFDPCAALG